MTALERSLPSITCLCGGQLMDDGFCSSCSVYLLPGAPEGVYRGMLSRLPGQLTRASHSGVAVLVERKLEREHEADVVSALAGSVPAGMALEVARLLIGVARAYVRLLNAAAADGAQRIGRLTDEERVALDSDARDLLECIAVICPGIGEFSLAFVSEVQPIGSELHGAMMRWLAAHPPIHHAGGVVAGRVTR